MLTNNFCRCALVLTVITAGRVDLECKVRVPIESRPFPWLVDVVSTLNGTCGMQRCAGTAIGSRHVLTAAKCLFYPSSWYRKCDLTFLETEWRVENALRLSSRFPYFLEHIHVLSTGPMKSSKVAKIHIHPEYRTNYDLVGQIFDVAILELEDDYDGDTAVTACTQNKNISRPESDDHFIVMQSGSDDPPALYNAMTFDESECRRLYGDPDHNISEFLICFNDTPEESQSVALGSPLVVNASAVFEVVGIAAVRPHQRMSLDDVLEVFPTSFSRVQRHCDFINSVLRNA